MHSKIILYSLYTIPPSSYISFVHPSSKLPKDGYIYLGSHNHTRAAWGSFQAKNDTIHITNWELGVIIPFWFVTEDFDYDFRIPFQLPPREYGDNDLQWIMSELL